MSPVEASSDSRLKPLVAYCGFSDTANVGDYALFRANARLFPRLELVSGEHESAVASLFGGGTSYPYCLRYGTYPRRRVRAAIGIGVEDPAFSGRFGPLTLLAMHTQRCKVFGVRGYRSQRILARHGLTSVVTGDTALALAPPDPCAERADAVGVSLVGEQMQRVGDPTTTETIVGRYCRRVISEGCEVVLVPFARTDLASAKAMRDSLGDGVKLLNFWAPPIGEDLGRFLSELARLRFMVAERLHAAVLAAAMSVPFVALPYKPKCLDFTESLDEGLAVDYARLSSDELWRRTRVALEADAATPPAFVQQVHSFRSRLAETAGAIEDLLFRI